MTELMAIDRSDITHRHTREVLVGLDAVGRCNWASGPTVPILGYRIDELIGMQVVSLVHPDDQRVIVDALNVLPGDPAGAACSIRLRHGNGGWVSVDLFARPDAITSDIVVSVLNISEHAMRADDLDRRLRTEDLLRRLALGFIDVPASQLELAISQAVADLARANDADRAELVSIDHETSTARLITEWCAPHVPSLSNSRARIPLHRLAPVLAPLFELQPVVVHSAEQLSLTSPADAMAMRNEGVQSFAAVPIVDHGRLAAVLTFESVTHERPWVNDDLAVLRSACALIGQALARRRLEAELIASQQRMRLAFADAPIGIIVTDTDGRFIETNPAFCRLVERTPEELIGSLGIEITHPDDRAEQLAQLTALNDGANDRSVFIKRYLRPDGSSLWCRLTWQAIRTADGTHLRTVAVVEDISEQHRAEVALAASEQRMRDLLDNMPDPVVRVSAQGARLYANRAALGLAGSNGQLLADEVAASARLSVAEVIITGVGMVDEYELSHGDATRFYQAKIEPEFGHDDSVVSVLIVCRDLTDRRQGETELAHAAMHDVLTSLPNRKLFLSLLEHAIAGQSRKPTLLAVLFFDLDRFKLVNDSIGHHVGDELLQVVANRLRKTLRPEDVVARFGGDEFVVLLENLATPTEAVQAAERLQRALAAPVMIAGHELFTGASIGIALSNDGSQSPAEMIRRADAAMYRAKEHGRGRSEVFDETLQSQVNARLDMERGLRAALDKGELEVHYQPEVDLATGEALGVEALVRWRHPERGLMVAEDFVDLAETTGLIVPIGAFVLNEATQMVARLNQLRPGRPLVCRVNLSNRQLNQPELVGVVRDALTRSGLPANLLSLELTERSVMSDVAAARIILGELVSHGITIALDDFGTGLSSLAELRRLPVSILKIDESFVAGLPTNTEDAAIVATIIALAETLGLQVIAEGVETAEQARSLVAAGCRTGHGFFFAGPTRAAELRAW
jgi:diguanylate cyclase (GGDEF)-like protein/PAS domain S-box-containing protein